MLHELHLSPYTELSFSDLNEAGVPLDADVNPYYRYNDIFKAVKNPMLSQIHHGFSRESMI
jgi:hypothetical protein